MKRLVFLFSAICYVAMAQDFHGVSMTGTNKPVISNSSSNPPLLGMVYVRYDSSGLNLIHIELNLARIITGKLLQPGETFGGPPGPYRTDGNLKRRFQRIDSTGKVTHVVEGDILDHKVIAVLFADGTFYSRATGADLQTWQTNPDGTPKLDANGHGIDITEAEAAAVLFNKFASDIAAFRGMGQSLQGLTAADRKLALSRISTPAPPAPGTSRDPNTEGRNRQLGIMLSQLDEAAQTAAIGYLVALPDVVKGE